MPLIPFLHALGYALLGLFYAISGLLHFRHFGTLSAGLSAKGIPWPNLVLAVGSVFQTIAGAMLAAQVQVRFSAFGLAVFTLLATAMFFDVWRLTGQLRQAAIRTWQTHLALVGALLVLGTS